jgi:hypothetical protein
MSCVAGHPSASDQPIIITETLTRQMAGLPLPLRRPTTNGRSPIEREPAADLTLSGFLRHLSDRIFSSSVHISDPSSSSGRQADKRRAGAPPPVLFTGALTALHACLYVLPAAAGLLVVLGLPGPGGHETVCHCEPACPPGHVTSPLPLASFSAGLGLVRRRRAAIITPPSPTPRRLTPTTPSVPSSR